MTRALQSAVDTDIAGLADIYASGGAEELTNRLADRRALVSTEGRRAHYLITTNGNTQMAKWPKLDASLSEFGYVRLDTGQQVFARATRISPDLTLLVAREYGDDSALLMRLSLIFLAALIAIPACVWIFARQLAGRLSRRVARINGLLLSHPDEDGQLSDAETDIADEVGALARHSARLVKRLRAAAQAQRYVTDQVAHEIKTPLMHLDMKLTRMQQDQRYAHLTHELADGRKDLKNITGLLDNLLDIAASEAQRGDISRLKQVDLSALLGNMLELYEASLEDAGMHYSADITDGVSMMAEEMQIRRLISNLFDNAIKYAGKGSTLSVSLDLGPKLIIADDGPGIAEDLRSNLYDRFSRGSSNLQQNGHGLGLALAKAICERHLLKITLQNNHKGCSFLIEPKEGDHG
ncbi:MAG: HAMP domain-containing histidine kinase [Sphingomonadales bacterium]|nr:HAMP domain-containing histidine kinase [Sphingomonadales bacterium]